MTWAWSHKDPLIIVDGRTLTVDLAAWAESPDHDFANACTGPIELTITIPNGSTASYQIPAGDSGWGGKGYAIEVMNDATLHKGTDSTGVFAEVGVVAYVPADLALNGGNEWRMKLELTPARDPVPVVKLFRSNAPSAVQTVRV